MVHSGTAFVPNHLVGALHHVVGVQKLIPEAVPYGSFLAFFQALQHGFGPDTPFHPPPYWGVGFFGLLRPRYFFAGH